MKLVSLTAVNDFSYGTLVIGGDSHRTEIRLRPDDLEQLGTVAERIYESHQQRIADEIAKPLPRLADFSEVPND